MTIDEEIRRASKLLETVIQVSGVSQEDLDKKLEASPGYVGRILAGEVELKLRHILVLLRTVEMEPAIFFQTLYEKDEPTGGTVQLGDLEQRVKALGFIRD